jgi:hypothetical protein
MGLVGLTCANCKNEFEMEAMAGQQVVCPACRQFVLVPGTPEELPTWFLSRDGQQYGPYTMAQLQKMVSAGKLQPADLIWKEGMPTWVEARSIPEIKAVMELEASLVPVHVAEAGPPAYLAGGAGGYFQPGGAEGTPFWSDLWVIIRRIVAWNLPKVPLTDSENQLLQARGIENEIARKYLAWRRSILLAVAVTTGIGAIIYFITSLVQLSIELDLPGGKLTIPLSPFGVFTVVIRILCQFALPATAILAFIFWARLRLSRRLIVIGWLVSFLTPLVIALFPLNWLFSVPPLANEQEQMAAHAVLGFLGGLAYFITFTPTVLSLIPGVLRACVRVKALLPESIISGWFLLAGAPLYALLLLVTFITINQLAGNALLILGVLLFMGAPLAFLFGGQLFIRPLTEDRDIRKIRYIQLVYAATAGVAMLLLLIYLFTAKFFGKTIMGFSSATSLFLPWTVIQYYIDFMGRSLFTSTLFADLLLWMNFSVWHHLSQFNQTDHARNYDQLMGQVGDMLHKG